MATPCVGGQAKPLTWGPHAASEHQTSKFHEGCKPLYDGQRMGRFSICDAPNAPNGVMSSRFQRRENCHGNRSCFMEVLQLCTQHGLHTTPSMDSSQSVWRKIEQQFTRALVRRDCWIGLGSGPLECKSNKQAILW